MKDAETARTGRLVGIVEGINGRAEAAEFTRFAALCALYCPAHRAEKKLTRNRHAGEVAGLDGGAGDGRQAEKDVSGNWAGRQAGLDGDKDFPNTCDGSQCRNPPLEVSTNAESSSGST